MEMKKEEQLQKNIPASEQHDILHDEDVKMLIAGGKLLVSGEPHYSLQELKELASSRKSWGEFWEMPAHLLSCPQCLDLFEVLMMEDPAADEAILERMRNLHPLRKVFLPCLKFRPFSLLKVAAAVAIIAATSWFAFEYSSAPSVRILDGEILLSGGKTMASGSVLPDKSSLMAAEPTSAVFNDGSLLQISKNSLVSFQPTRFQDNTVQLSDGHIYCEISKQKSGRSFRVVTPAGEIVVVGTKFSVESRSSRQPDAEIQRKDQASDSVNGKNLKFLHPLDVGVRDQSGSESPSESIVTVKVDEGAVIVKNRYGSENRLAPGQTAVLRSGISMIDVFQENILK